VTKQHYVDPDTLRNSASRRIIETLTSAEGDAGDLIERALALPPDALQALRRAIDGKTAT
jgi:hypothetical protein